MEKLTNLKEETSLLNFWQERYRDARNKYQPIIAEIIDNRKAYEGTREIVDSKGKKAAKQYTNVRKVCFELVEAQADTNIPLPKVISTDGYEEQAMTIEMFIKNEIDRLNIEEINDQQSRSTLIDGGSVFFIEWNNNLVSPHFRGGVSVQNIDTLQVTPQPGIYDIEKMDYIFIEFEQTRDYIKNRYGVSLPSDTGNASAENDTGEEKVINEDVYKHINVFYRNSDDTIGLFSWVDDTPIQNFKNYFARYEDVCTKCSKPKTNDVCECGNKAFKKQILTSETITLPMQTLDPMTGQPIIGEKQVEIPYYVPKFFPIVIRKNVSKLNRFLGSSDVQYIKDQQNDLNIYGTKIREKLLKGGSLLIKPKGLNFKADNEELKILDVENPQQMSQIEVKNLQVDVSRDLSMLDTNYMIARQTIGITDTFQGRQDPTATSGKAKEIAAAQTAGRLTSKRAMKDFAFSKLYEYMFKLMLAFADEPRSYAELDTKGQMLYKKFNRFDFIIFDGEEPYYNDDFIFSTDVSSTLSNNREAMWQETRSNFMSGTYGVPNEIGSLIMFWNMMNILHYPGAKQALAYLEERKQEAEMIRQQEMIAKNIQDSNVENIMTRNKMNELDLQNQIAQLKNQQVQKPQNMEGE